MATVVLSCLCGCPGWGSHPFVEEPRVVYGATGSLHLVVTRAISTEGGPHGHTLQHAVIEEGGVLDKYLPGARAAHALVADGQGRVILHALSPQNPADGAFLVFEDGTWGPVPVEPGADIAEDLLALFRGSGAANQAHMWNDTEGTVRIAVPHSDDLEQPGARVFTVQAGSLAGVVWAPLPEGCTGFFRMDASAPGGPVALLTTEGGDHNWPVARLSCDAGCTWNLDPGDGITASTYPGQEPPFVVTAAGVPVLVYTRENEAGQIVTELAWPGGSTSIDTKHEYFREAARGVDEGLVLALYQGHDARSVDLVVVDAEFEHRSVEIDLEGKYGMYLQLLVCGSEAEPRVELFYTNGATVHQRSVNLSSEAEQTQSYAFKSSLPEDS